MRTRYTVAWASVAERDLQTVAEFLTTDDPAAAAHVLDQIEARTAALQQMPERGRVVPELAAFGIHTYRELIVTPWRIIYRISEQTVYVLAVLDGRRNVEDVLLDRLINSTPSGNLVSE
jgi:plasmid stabilization system protein ParE